MDNVSPAAAEPDATSFEQSLAALEAIVHDLEEGQIGLAEALARYEQGVKHLRRCYQLLDEAEQKISLLTGITESGAAIAEPFAQAEEPLAASAGRRRRTRRSAEDEPGSA